MRLLLDTNILLDFFTGRSPFAKSAERLLVMAAMGDAELWASAKSTTDIFYIMHKQYEKDAIYGALEKSMNYIHYCSIDAADVKEAVARRWPDFEDSIVALCAEKTEADFLITRDRNGFERSKVTAIDPKAFFGMLKQDWGLTYEDIDW